MYMEHYPEVIMYSVTKKIPTSSKAEIIFTEPKTLKLEVSNQRKAPDTENND